MIDTFHAKKMNVVAEGIETEAEFNTMKELGADFFQGYYLGMPKQGVSSSARGSVWLKYILWDI